MKRIAILPTLLLLAVAHNGAAEGTRYLHQPTVITTPGDYRLTRDILAVTGDAVEIHASGVVLDLGGFLAATEDDEAAAISIADGETDVMIRNGRLDGGIWGIVYESTTARIRLQIENVSATDSEWGFYVAGAEHVEILHNEALACLVDGIYVDGVNDGFSGRVIGNRAATVGNGGIVLLGLRGGKVRGNQISGHGGSGILLGGLAAWDPGGNVVEDNVVSAGTGASIGIRVETRSSGNLLRGNALSGNVGVGVEVHSDGNRVLENVSTGNGDKGIDLLGSRTVVSGNQLAANGQAGIRIGGLFNVVESNVIEGNAALGIDFRTAGSHLYRNNVLRDNGAGAVGGQANTDGGGNIQ